ncbi:MAG: hydantoinase/oxoprolinase family protein [Rhizobiaceae bacterium]
MTLLLGIDTGGTFTDAVILEADNKGLAGKVLAKAKALTTRHDLAVGIAGAIKAAIENSNCDPKNIGLVSLSTTLATNALVEGQGERVALISIGFQERDLQNARLADALGKDPVVILEGGHTTHGNEEKPLDLAPLITQLDELAKTVSGFAVAGYFAVRNPAHELAVRDLILKQTGKAVTCSHELSAQLNGPKRALTTVLNARLVPMITQLIMATKKTLHAHNVKAPLMVVRGDGSLISADFASRRPIETILSGPAASLIGARFLTGEKQAFVNDIGGTTSDVAVLENGNPKLDPNGALVGGYRTMVEAVAMHTFGLGGDSEVSLKGTGLNRQINLGPKRLVPISLVAQEYPKLVHRALDDQLKSIINNRHDGRFVFKTGAGMSTGLSVGETKLLDQIAFEPRPVEGLFDGAAQNAALNTLVSRGLVLIAGLTPSDAMHALDEHGFWDKEAARKALQLFAKKRDGGGKAVFENYKLLAKTIKKQVERRSAEVVLETAFQLDGEDGNTLTNHSLIQNHLDKEGRNNNKDSMVEFSLKLDRPLIGLGASAHAYHPGAAKLLGVDAIVPKNADVANAIGAVVGQISMRVEIVITQPQTSRFQVSGINKIYDNEKTALAAAEVSAREKVTILARKAGALELEITTSKNEKRAIVESSDMLLEATITAIAAGRPPIATRNI